MMDHERIAPLLRRVILAGLILGVMFLVQAGVGGGAVATPPWMTVAGMISAILVAVFFLRVVFFDLSDRRGLTLAIGAVIVVVAVLQVTLLVTPWGVESPRAVIDLTPLFMRFAFALLVALVLAAYVSHRLNEIYGLLAALILLTAPPFLASSMIGPLPLALAFYGTSALFCVFLWGETGELQWSAMTGLCVVFGACSIIWDSAAFSAVPERIAFIGLLPLVSRSVLLIPAGEEHLAHMLILGPAMVCFLPWAFKGKWSKEKRILLAIAGTIVVITSYSGALKTLGFLPIIPLLAVLATFGIHNLYMNVRRPPRLFVAVVILLAWNAMIFWK